MSDLDIHAKETIDLVHSLFLKRENSEPEDSAKYYVIYTFFGCGSSFTSLHKEIKKTFNLKGLHGRRDLENGRKSLIEEGILARILFHHKTDMGEKKEAKIFQGEQYLPVNPLLVYNDISQRLDNKYGVFDSDRILLEQLHECWERNFMEHGFLINEGIMSVFCTAPWLLFSLLNYLSIGKEKTLYIVTSSTNWCKPPLFLPLKSKLESGLNLKVLLDTSRKTKELEELEQMKGVKIRNLHEGEAITNRLTFAGNKYVVDMHKVLGTEGKYSNYVATIYLNMSNIAEQFRKSFEARWEYAKSY